ncbi:head-tail connector protein [Neptuniibacter pectenicola]|uniref:head-tail connector protein n=1 Tax=Neptuniibacter pectenicola TaxID=1806669 RepID=UPI00082C0F55|nr:head-tail connector protein [Neptuniibacter pectenicola]
MPIIDVTPPAEQPITLEEARIQCQIDSDITDEDDLIESYIAAATNFCESYTGRPLITQEKQYVGAFCRDIELTPNLLSVESITYIDSDGNLQTLAPSSYYIDTASVVGRVIPLEPWPKPQDNHPQPVTVNFTCGYADAAAVPESIKQCMRLLVGHFYRNREPIVIAASATTLDFSVDSLLNPHRVFRI